VFLDKKMADVKQIRNPLHLINQYRQNCRSLTAGEPALNLSNQLRRVSDQSLELSRIEEIVRKRFRLGRHPLLRKLSFPQPPRPQEEPRGCFAPGSFYLRDVEVPPNKAELLGLVSGDFV